MTLFATLNAARESQSAICVKLGKC